ncbi:MAG: SEL1-like repeat protein, partial [Gammaproteobacteria bacterium]|nr:SEL1-like repeat protein [Gammaproteobacteria bacterium]
MFADDLSDAKNAYGAGQFEEAATLLRPLVRQENIEAVYLLARMYEQGDGVEKDLGEAKRLFRIAAEKGNDAAQQRLDIFDAQGADDSVVIEWYLPS